ncbi:MAG: hypothetical protein N5P05_003690 [Chroococcopsis gigantea SAG 12.99]|jgi:predicted kinase|nr:AAA family ATPase [Chlorogloea purpurea SAG 13.99]MDV3002084.1 hypothetical protein [Chroococcopsis gigantea SAG 12.99]
MSLICYVLIGCPGSGKSTLAHKFVSSHDDYRIVSTDSIREKLFGEACIQGDWSLIETEVLRQIDEHINGGRPIIYDATNARRPWRMDLLRKLPRYEDVYWVGWNLKTPLETCKQWNKQRSFQVPDFVIDTMTYWLKRFPPALAEGFTCLKEVDSSKDKFPVVTLNDVRQSIVNKQNNSSKFTFHSYSRLEDFDRLLHLISTLIHYPGAGNLQTSDPEYLKNLLGPDVNFSTDIDEISALLSRHADPFYAGKQEIAKDLSWLENNGFIGNCYDWGKIEIETVNDPTIISHAYADLDTFQRLMTTIRFILHHPLIYDEDRGVLDALLIKMKAQKAIDQNLRDSIRKDIEKVLKPFKIFPSFPMRKGYFIGTGILSQNDLTTVFQLLETQAQSLEDPSAIDVYQRFKQRMEDAKLTTSEAYQVRAIYNRNVFDSDDLKPSSLAKKIEDLEGAIECGNVLKLGRFQGVGSFAQKPDKFFQAIPLQIVFHNIGWYLGYQIVREEQKGLYEFERLDRLYSVSKAGESLTKTEQRAKLKQLQKLYEYSAGIYLGKDPLEQQTYLSNDRKNVEITVEIWCQDCIFKFISEEKRRFGKHQMKMSPPKGGHGEKKAPFTLPPTGDENYSNRLQITLPKWASDSIDFRGWLVGFGGQIKIIKPVELAVTVKDLARGIVDLYAEADK